MVPQTQITEVKADLEYVLAHHSGPTYTGPSGGLGFVDGLVDGPISGAQLLQNGLANITHFWEVRPGHVLQWSGDVINGSWSYVPVVVEPAPKAKPASKSKPMRKAKAKKAKGKK
jgi:hypothetical protein